MSDAADISIQLPEDPSEEELARDWTLSASDLGEVLHSRDDVSKLHFATQVCALRNVE